MNRSLYTTGIIFGWIFLAYGFLLAMAFLTLGFQLFQSPSFQIWRIVGAVIVLSGNTILLKYFKYKRYLVAFNTLLVALIAFLVTTIVEIAGGTGVLGYVTLYVYFGASITFFLSLIFSKVAERPLLKKAGIISLFIGFILILTFTLVLTYQGSQMVGTLFKIYIWVNILSSLIAIFYIQNFQQESGIKVSHA